MLKAVLFDMDGTLIDTEPLHKWAWEKIMIQHGYDLPDDLMMKCIGLNHSSMEKLFAETFGKPVDMAALLKECTEIIDKYQAEHGVAVKKGYRELAEYLKMRSIKMMVATSSRHEDAVKTLKTAGIYSDFYGLIGGDEVSKGKPDKEPFEKAACLAGAEPEECLAVEDSDNGIKSAVSAGIKCVYIRDMKDIPEEIEKITSYKCEDLSEIINIIEKEL